MKRYVPFVLVMVSLVLSFGAAFAQGPGFGISAEWTKIGDHRDGWSSGMHGLIVDGLNVYTARDRGLLSNTEIVMDKSNDGGVTWAESTVIASDSNVKTRGKPVMAINPVTKAFHYAWNSREPLSQPARNVYYSNGAGKTRVNGSIADSYRYCTNIAVTKDGVIHIVFAAEDRQLYYVSSSDNGVTFSAPAAIGTGIYMSLAADSAGNLFLAYMGNGGFHFIKKSVGGNWGASNVVCAACDGNAPSIAVYDSSRIYFTAGLKVFATSDGGQTWTSYPIPGNNAGYARSLAISSDGILNLAWEEEDGVHFVRTAKSLDPSSWGTEVLALAGASLPHIAVDSAGKAYILADIFSDGRHTAIFKKEK